MQDWQIIAFSVAVIAAFVIPVMLYRENKGEKVPALFIWWSALAIPAGIGAIFQGISAHGGSAFIIIGMVASLGGIFVIYRVRKNF